MKIQRSWLLSVLTIIALVIAVHEVRAQSYPAGMPPQDGYYPAGGSYLQPGFPGPAMRNPGLPGPQYGPGMAPAAPAGYAPPPGMYGPAPMPYGPQPAAYYNPQEGALQPMPEGPGAPMPMMGGPGMPMMGAPGMEGYYGGAGGEGYCQQCGGYGCELCAGHDDFDLKLLRWLLPYGAGGCYAQRWYDVSADWLYLKRDDIGRPQAFTSDGINGPIVLDTNDLDLNDGSGFRVSVAIQLGAGNNFETTYLGGANWATAAQVTGNNNLFSVMSGYGLTPFNGFDDTDRAALQRIEYSSSFDTIEMNYRQRWVAPNARVQGSWLAGARFMYLDEDFRYFTDAPANPGMMDYLVNTTNSMTGGQVGGDLWVCIMPGLKIGGEARVGIYGNHATQRTSIQADSLVPTYREKISNDLVSFLGDANVTLLWRINQNWTFRAGYMFLYMDAVALASDNFNAAPPFVTDVRVPMIDDNGDVFYHGLTLGLEWMW